MIPCPRHGARWRKSHTVLGGDVIDRALVLHILWPVPPAAVHRVVAHLHDAPMLINPQIHLHTELAMCASC